MAYTTNVKLVNYSGSTTISEELSASIATLVDLNEEPPATPSGHSTGYWCSMVNYAPKASRGEEDVTDAVDLLLQSYRATAAAAKDKLKILIGNIERALGFARRFEAEGYGYRVHVRYGWTASDGDYISVVRGGTLVIEDYSAITTGHNVYRMRAVLVLSRGYYWESLADTALSLTNTNGTSSAGLEVDNCNDANQDNFLTFTPAGDIPSPAIIKITNNYASATNNNKFWVGHRIVVGSETFTTVYEAELSTAGGTPGVDVAQSNGEYTTVAIGTTEAKELSWSMTAANMDAFMGKYYRALIRFRTQALTGLKMRLKVEYGGTALWTGPLVDMSTAGTAELQELGNLRLPPYLIRSTGLAALDLCVFAYDTTGGNVDVDFLALLPLDGLRTWTPRGAGQPQNSILVDDMRYGEFYLSIGGTKLGGYQGQGAAIMLWPNVANRLYFHWLDANGDALPARTVTAIVNYRPRRRTVGTV